MSGGHVLLQEVSSSIRAGMNTIVLLINNQGYTVEEELHSGTYNKIPNWDYSLFAQALADTTPIFTSKV
jgi:pyruvate decarboxylase